MKLRNSAAAVLAACALVLTLPGSAVAATGEFHYKYIDDSGQQRQFDLQDPQSDECINLYGVDSDDLPPGFGPHNSTDSWATVYVGVDCDGPAWRLKPYGKPARDALELRSVRFDHPE